MAVAVSTTEPQRLNRLLSTQPHSPDFIPPFHLLPVTPMKALYSLPAPFSTKQSTRQQRTLLAWLAAIFRSCLLLRCV